MATSDDRRAATLASLVEQLEAADPARIVDVLDAELRRTLGIEAVWLYIVDYGAETLRPVPPAAAAPPPPDALPVRTTVAGRAFLSQTPLWATAPRPLLWVPLSQRGEHLGLLALVHDGSAEARARIAPLATALGLLVASAVAAVRGSYDALQIARGALELELAAAIQWGLLLPSSYRDSRLQVAARIEPAVDMAGDAYDFALTGTSSFGLALFDGMGHSVEAALLSVLAVSAYRLARTRSPDLTRIAAALDAAIEQQGRGERFVTGNLTAVDLDTGTLSLLSAGHPQPILVREGRATEVDVEVRRPPFGISPPDRPVARLDLQPGDVVLLYTDGVVEARQGSGRRLGVEGLQELAVEHFGPKASVPLATRLLMDTVHVRRASADDDATLVAVRWSGPPENRLPLPDSA
jgi:serine phosphatase RsbU (regulator of sigma subunit)